MGKQLTHMLGIVGIVLGVVAFAGCQKDAKPPPKAQVVSKKITADGGADGGPASGRIAASGKITVPGTTGAVDTPPEAPAAGATKAPAIKQGEVVLPSLAKAPPAAPPETASAAAPPGVAAPGAAAELTVPVFKPRQGADLTRFYNPEGKLDPFKPLIQDQPEVAVQPQQKKKRIPLTPIEKIDLDQLKLVAVIRLGNLNKAMVEEASGKGYVIQEGTYIGNQGGRVVDILKESVIVEEEVINALGKVTVRKRELRMQKPPGE